MTNGKVYQGFHNDKKVEEHWSNININFQTNLQTLIEDFGWNKYVIDNASMNASVAPIHLKLFSFQ